MIDTIHNSPIRNGNFTSSEIVALTTNGKEKGSMGKPAKTYISECNMERRLTRSISTEANARPLVWGKLIEGRIFNLLGTEYQITSNKTDIHPTTPYWVGSKDTIKFDEGKTVGDFKCPTSLKSFCNLVDGLYQDMEGFEAMQYARDNHADGDKFYWQLVSNAVINDCKFGELIVYVPYKSELDAIREMASNYDGDQKNLAWIGFGDDEDFSYLVDGGFYKNINIIRFQIPETDKQFLTDRVLAAGKLLQTI